MDKEELINFDTYSIEIFSEINDLDKKLPVNTNNNIPRRSDTFRLCFTYPDDFNLEQETISIIQYAIKNNHPIFFSSFIINYQPIVERLVEAAEVLKGMIYVLTSFDQNDPRIEFVNNEDKQTHFSNLQKTANAGIRLRSYSNAHWKVILSGNRGLISSANCTFFSYRVNPEVGVTIDKIRVEKIKELFVHIWKFHTEKERRGSENRDLKLFDVDHECQNLDFGKIIRVISNFNYIDLENIILTYLSGNSPKSIKLMIWKLTNTKIINRLNEMAQTGVDIEIILSETMKLYNSNFAFLKKLDSRITISFYRRTHAKLLIIDERKALISTGNFDNYLTKAEGLDLFVFTKKPKIVSDALSFFQGISSLSSRDIPTIEIGEWEEYIELDILIDLPTRVHHSIPVKLSTLVENLRKNQIEFYHEPNATFLKYGNNNNKLVKLNDYYKISSFNFEDLERRSGKSPVFYERIVFNFIWQVLD